MRIDNVFDTDGNAYGLSAVNPAFLIYMGRLETMKDNGAAGTDSINIRLPRVTVKPAGDIQSINRRFGTVYQSDELPDRIPEHAVKSGSVDGINQKVSLFDKAADLVSFCKRIYWNSNVFTTLFFLNGILRLWLSFHHD